LDLNDYKSQLYAKKEDPILIKEVALPKDCVGWLVIDSLKAGRSAGGVRTGENVTLAEVKLLASDMTLKYSFYNVRHGGAKAGIYCPDLITKKEREDLFFNFGKGLKSLLHEKVFNPGTDMGTDRKDIEQIFKGAGINVKPDNEFIDSSYYTGVSVFAALKAAAAFKGIELKGARIGIQGLGKVGMNILRLAFDSGLKLVTVSTSKGALHACDGFDIKKIFNLVVKSGDDFVNQYQDAQKISLGEFFEKDMDIMCPCAGIYPIHEGNMEQIKAKIIVPGCNVPADKEVERWLYKNGIIYLPGFVCNAGGVLGFVLKGDGIEKENLSDFLSRGIQNRVKSLMAQAEQRGISQADVARKMAQKNQARFALESKAKMTGNLTLLIEIIRKYGTAEIFRIILARLHKRKIPTPNFVKNWFIKKYFERLFTNSEIVK
jgi:glutamate dehydrogenase (NAD(P)+)